MSTPNAFVNLGMCFIYISYVHVANHRPNAYNTARTVSSASAHRCACLKATTRHRNATIVNDSRMPFHSSEFHSVDVRPLCTRIHKSWCVRVGVSERFEHFGFPPNVRCVAGRRRRVASRVSCSSQFSYKAPVVEFGSSSRRVCHAWARCQYTCVGVCVRVHLNMRVRVSRVRWPTWSIICRRR